MNGRMLLQLSYVALYDAEAIVDAYAWPPRAALSEDERREAERLRTVSARLFYMAAAKGWGGAGSDEAFGQEKGGDVVSATAVTHVGRPRPLSAEQKRVLQHYHNGDGAGESWTCMLTNAADRFAWYRHERTIDSLERRGLIDSDGITEAGRAALAAAGGRP